MRCCFNSSITAPNPFSFTNYLFSGEDLHLMFPNLFSFQASILLGSCLKISLFCGLFLHISSFCRCLLILTIFFLFLCSLLPGAHRKSSDHLRLNYSSRWYQLSLLGSAIVIINFSFRFFFALSCISYFVACLSYSLVLIFQFSYDLFYSNSAIHFLLLSLNN